MLTSVQIQNFRGFQNLTIPDFGKINIFIGKNGVGKTSVLESLLLVAYPSPLVHPRLAVWRGIDYIGESLQSLFYDSSLPIRIDSTTIKDGSYSFKIHPLSQYDIPDSRQFSETSPTYPATLDELRGVRHEVHQDENLLFEQSVFFKGLEIKAERPKIQNFRNKGGFFIEGRKVYSQIETSDMLTQVRANRQMENLLGSLRLLNPDIKDIYSGTYNSSPQIYVDLGEKTIPYRWLGDGFGRLLLILTGLLNSNSDCLIIDEIDSGLHYSVMFDIWEMLSAHLSKSGGDKQLFCATHNEEMLQSVLPALEPVKDDVRIFRIERDVTGNIRPVTISYDEYKIIYDMGLEIR